MKEANKLVFIFLFSILLLSFVGMVYADDSGNLNVISKGNYEKENHSQGLVNQKILQKAFKFSGQNATFYPKNNYNKSEEEREKLREHIKEKVKEKIDEMRNKNRTEFENEFEHFFVNRKGVKTEIRIRTHISDGKVEREIELEGYNLSSRL